MKCNRCVCNSYETYAKILAVLAGIGSAYAFSIALVSDILLDLAAWIFFGVAAAIGLLLLGTLLFESNKSRIVKRCLCEYAGKIALGVIGTIIIAIVIILVTLSPVATVSLILVGLLAFFFIWTILYVALFGYCVYCRSCSRDDECDQTISSGTF